MLDPADREVLRAMPRAKWSKAVRRLAVIEAWRSPRRYDLFVDAADAARRAGVSTASFYRLLERTPKPSLAGLGLHVAPRSSQNGKAAGRMDVAAAEAAALLEEGRSVTAGRLAKSLEQDEDARVSRATAGRALAEARRRRPAAEPFGRLLAFDAASLDAIDAEGERQRLYAALDVSTGLVLAWCIAADLRFDKGYAGVAEAYLARSGTVASVVGGLRDVECEPSVVQTEISLPRDVDFEVAKLLHSAASLLGDGSGRALDTRPERAGAVLVTDPRAIGRRLRAAVGGRLADYRLAAGLTPADTFHRAGAQPDLPILTEGGRSRVEAAIGRHNRERLDLALPGRGGRAIEEVFDIMKLVVKLEP